MGRDAQNKFATTSAEGDRGRDERYRSSSLGNERGESHGQEVHVISPSLLLPPQRFYSYTLRMITVDSCTPKQYEEALGLGWAGVESF